MALLNGLVGLTVDLLLDLHTTGLVHLDPGTTVVAAASGAGVAAAVAAAIGC